MVGIVNLAQCTQDAFLIVGSAGVQVQDCEDGSCPMTRCTMLTGTPSSTSQVA
jgi:hypothetical protein